MEHRLILGATTLVGHPGAHGRTTLLPAPVPAPVPARVGEVRRAAAIYRALQKALGSANLIRAKLAKDQLYAWGCGMSLRRLHEMVRERLGL